MTPTPSPLQLARMHEAEFKQHVEDAVMMHRLIEQIMVGRVVTVPRYGDRLCTITKVKLAKSTIQLFGKIKGQGGHNRLLCVGLDLVQLVQPETI